MKVKPIRKFLFSSYDESPEQRKDKLIALIDELVMSTDHLTSDYRIMTSMGVVNFQKCLKLKEHLCNRQDDRSIRISNLLERLMKLHSR